MEKRGQMKLSFGMIFSIFLIIAFIVFAFFAIQKFLGTKDQLQHKQFIGDFQSDVDKMWKSSQGSQDVSYSLPNSIKEVCLTVKCGDLGLKFSCYSLDDNLVFNSTKKNFDSTYISHLDMDNIFTEDEGRIKCFKVTDGKVHMRLIKKYNENNVGVADVY
jgi:hypothetical protein